MRQRKSADNECDSVPKKTSERKLGQRCCIYGRVGPKQHRQECFPETIPNFVGSVKHHARAERGLAEGCVTLEAPGNFMAKSLEIRPTWTPKVCKIMAFMAIISGLGLLFYILLGSGRVCTVQG